MANTQTPQTDDAANLQALVGGAQAAPQPTGAPALQDDAANLHSLMEADAQASKTPEETGISRNSDGSWVITPKEGESFADTMKRAAEMGKTVSPQMIQSQTKKGLKEAPIVLAAAPAMGAAGSAALVAPAELPGAAERVLQISEKALEHLAENYPNLAKLADKLGYGAGAVGAYKLLKKLGID